MKGFAIHPFEISSVTFESRLESEDCGHDYPPGPYKPLKFAGEIAGIEIQSSPWASTSCLDRPNRESVLYALGSCTIAHCACHAIVDNIDPAKSALLLGRDVEERLIL